MGPFDGVRVLDLADSVAGGNCTRLLAGFGADVVKVEPPEGDPTRLLPPFHGDTAGPERSGFFQYLNGGKRSIILDLDRAEGRELLDRLLPSFDVALFTATPGRLARTGLSVADLERIAAQRVVCAITPFGLDGPRADWEGTNLTLWAAGGALLGIGEADREPLQVGHHLVEMAGGTLAATAIGAALFGADDEHPGELIDIALMEACVLLRGHGPLMSASYLGEAEGELVRLNRARALNFPVPVKDGYVGLNVLTEGHWQALCGLAGMFELIDDPRFNTPQGRTLNDAELLEILRPWLATEEKWPLFHRAQDWRLPVGVVADAADVYAFEQHAARSFFAAVAEEGGVVRRPGRPFLLGEDAWRDARAPLPGEHTADVLGERLGLEPERIASLRQAGIVG